MLIADEPPGAAPAGLAAMSRNAIFRNAMSMVRERDRASIEVRPRSGEPPNKLLKSFVFPPNRLLEN